MRRALGAVAAWMVLAAAVQAGSYRNPVVGDPANPSPELADPHILKWNGEYTMYVSGNPVTAYRSRDLVHWEPLGAVFTAPADAGAWNATDIWAPEVVHRAGRFHMNYTASRKSDDWRVGERARRVGIATADSPAGPFVALPQPVADDWAIDGHVFRDPATGRDYFFYSSLLEPARPGAGIAVRRMAGPGRTEGERLLVTSGTDPWEDKDGDPGNGSLRYTNEAPTVLERHGLYYMMYSGGSWDLPTYGLSFATSPDPWRADWKKYGTRILASSSRVDGPGHHGIVAGPDNADQFVIYHARSVPFLDPWNRLPHLARLHWSHHRPWIDEPTTAPRPAPDRPLFQDLFDGAAGNSREAAGWTVTSGTWAVVHGQLEQQDAGALEALALPRVEPLVDYLFEANVLLGPANGGTGTAGVMACFLDPENHLTATLDVAGGGLKIAGLSGGEPVEMVSSPLPEELVPSAFHQLLVERRGPKLKLTLDGVVVFEQADALKPGRGVPGLIARGRRAAFDGVALAATFDEDFSRALADWEYSSGSWLVEEGALHQVGTPATRVTAIRGDAHRDLELAASLAFREGQSVESRAGVCVTSGTQAVLAGYDATIWPMGRFHVAHVDGEREISRLAFEMPRGFDPEIFHTIRLEKQGDAFSFHLDGALLGTARFPLGEVRAGLWTAGVRAAFDDCRVKRRIDPGERVLDAGFESVQWEQAKPGPGSPWTFEGSARIGEGPAQTGRRRVVIPVTSGAVAQRVPGVPAGKYRVSAFARSGAGVRGTLSAGGASTALGGGDWNQTTLEVELPATSELTIRIEGTIEAGGSPLEIDEVHLEEVAR